MLAYVGRSFNPEFDKIGSHWGCFATLPPPAAPSSGRDDYTAGNTLRYISELPIVLSDISVAAPDWSATCRQRVPFAKPPADTAASADASGDDAAAPRSRDDAAALTSNACEDRMDASAPCYRMRITRVCGPLEPMYGAAVLAVPHEASLLVFGGRAALQQLNDLPACSQAVPEGSAWRFQYHRELDPQVLASSAGTERALQ